jgi:hypothetical protein
MVPERLSSKKIGGKMWMLAFIPDSLLQTAILSVLLTGAGLYVFGLFINFFPSAYPYREPIRIIATILMVVGIYGYGSYANEMSWRAKVADMKAQVEAAQAKSQEVNTVIQTKIVVQKQVVHDRQVVVQKEIQVNEKLIDKDCKLDPVVVKILNDSAADPFKKQGGAK